MASILETPLGVWYPNTLGIYFDGSSNPNNDHTQTDFS